jgi:hypothetical protein
VRVKFKLPETDGPEIEVIDPFWTLRPKVYVDQKEIKHLKEKGKPYSIKLTDGTIKKIFIDDGLPDFVLHVWVDGKKLPLLRKLHAWEYVIAYSPLVLLSLGGAIGGGLGAIAAVTNLKILRFNCPTILRIILILAVISVVITLFNIWAPAAREFIYKNVK